MTKPPETITASRLSLSSFNPTAIKDAVKGSELLHTQLSSGLFQGRLLRVESDKITVDWGRYNLPLLGQGSFSRDSLTLGIVLRPKATAIFNGREFPRSSLLLFAESEELAATLPVQPEWIAIQLSRERLSALGFSAQHRGMVASTLSDSEASQLESQLMPALAVLDAESDDAYKPDHLQRLQALVNIDDLAMSAVNLLLSRTREAGISTCLSPAKEVAMRAADFIDDNLSYPLKISDVCIAARTTYRALNRAFSRSYGMSPKRYLTLKRLSKLRAILVTDEGSTQTLSQSFLNCGLAHFGRASANYRTMFGETPSASVKRFSGRLS